MNAPAGAPGTAGRGYRSPGHVPYYNRILDADYCMDDGEPWPCLHTRQNPPAGPPTCPRCHHRPHGDVCYRAVCGCAHNAKDNR